MCFNYKAILEKDGRNSTRIPQEFGAFIILSEKWNSFLENIVLHDSLKKIN